MALFTGLSAFPLTPTDDDGRLYPGLLGDVLERLVAAGADSIGLLGSTGGYAYLTADERKRTLRAAVECVAGRRPVIVGVSALRTDVAEDLARDAGKAGADGLLLAPMSYQPLNDAEVFQHFQAVSAAADLPLCIYNNPGTTKFSFSPDLIARLAELPNVTGVKMPLPADRDFTGELNRLAATTPEGFAIGYSGDWGAKDALLAGGACWFSVVAGLLPAPALALTRAAQAGDAAEAERVDQAFRPLWELFREYGSFRVMFALSGMLGLGRVNLGQVNPPRPLLPLPETSRRRVESALETLSELRGYPAP